MSTAQTPGFHEYEGIFFRVSGNGLEKPSYILGTLHTIPGDYVTQMPCFEQAFENIEQVITEFNYDEFREKSNSEKLKGRALERKMAQIDSLYIKRDGSLRPFTDDLPRQMRDQVLGSLNYWGFANRSEWTFSNIFNNFKEAYDKSELAKINQLGYNFTCWKYPIDFIITDSLARKYNIPVIGLDKPSAAGRELREESVNDLLHNRLGKRKEYSKLLGNEIMIFRNRYTPQEYIKLYFEHKFNYLKNSSDAEVAERNKWWMKQLPALINQKPSLIAVGYAHIFDLYDSEGILTSLEKLGYTIERIE
ncbi:MAG: TraB/GumN family protein [Bacteroidales bacterium]|nr:TraB/GumN family protein [Bacteroidales bacterium]